MIRWMALAVLTSSVAACGDGGDGGGDGGGGGDDTGSPQTVPQVEITINEFVATNESGLTDESGAFPDWVELYNGGDGEADLSGWWLTDDLGDILKWQFPDDTRLAAGGYLVVLCDGDTAEGPLHASFGLDRLAGSIALYGKSSDDNPLIDAVEDYGPQAADQSLARIPDGTANWEFDPTPTPGAANDGLEP